MYSVVVLTSLYLSFIFHATAEIFHNQTLAISEISISRRAECAVNQCGTSCGNCAVDYCCSPLGWCGNNKTYCAAPDCQLDYGSGCDANRVPLGVNTAAVTRAKVINGIPYGGVGIFHCTVPGTVAITFDDGPSEFSTTIMDVFDQYSGKATFFINGNNKGRGMINDPNLGWSAIIRRMYNDGHQVASHTWSHQSLDQISPRQRQNQMVYNEIALGNILGRFPTYMRPPFSQCELECQALMESLGYHVILFDLDIEDATSHPDLQTSLNDFSGNFSSKPDPGSNNWLVIGHEINTDTAHKVTEMMLKTINSKGFKAVTVGECLGDPRSNWYRHLDGSMDPPPPSKPKSTSTKIASAELSSAASTTPPASAKSADSASYTQAASFDSKIADASSISQTRSVVAAKSSIPFPSSTGSSPTISSVKPAMSPKSSSPAGLSVFNLEVVWHSLVSTFMGMLFFWAW